MSAEKFLNEIGINPWLLTSPYSEKHKEHMDIPTIMEWYCMKQTAAKDEQIKKLREVLVYARSFIVRADDWYGPDADMGLIDKVLQETEPKNQKDEQS